MGVQAHFFKETQPGDISGAISAFPSAGFVALRAQSEAVSCHFTPFSGQVGFAQPSIPSSAFKSHKVGPVKLSTPSYPSALPPIDNRESKIENSLPATFPFPIA